MSDLWESLMVVGLITSQFLAIIVPLLCEKDSE